MKQIDARGMECPQPVLLTKKAVEQERPDSIAVLVSSETSRGNVTRFAESQGYRVEVCKEGDAFKMVLSRESDPGIEAAPGKIPAVPGGDNVVVFITTDKFGSGSDELGALLMKAFINTLKEITPRPKTIIFANAGVYLTTEGSPVIDTLNLLAGEGIGILSCGTCLEFFKIKEKLQVGIISNMYTIAETLFKSSNVVKL